MTIKGKYTSLCYLLFAFTDLHILSRKRLSYVFFDLHCFCNTVKLTVEKGGRITKYFIATQCATTR